MHRRLLVGIAVSAGLASPAAVGASPVAPGRTVQLISMERSQEAVDQRALSSMADGEGEGADVDSPSELPRAFAVHDLSRRWIEHQMASSLAPAPGVDPSSATSTEAPLPIASAPPFSPGVASVSAIAVPAWMRGGRVFAAAATSFVPGCIPTDYRPSGLLGREGETRRQAYYAMMSGIACQNGIPVGLFDAMIIRESRYNAAIYSPKRAFGLTQLMPGTALDLGVDRYDVVQNLAGGARYLRQQLDRFGQYHLALAAYNAGPGRVRNGSVPPIAETQQYVANILLNWSRLSGLGRVATVTPATEPARLAPRFERAAVVATF